MNKVQKIRAEIERLYNQSLVDENRQVELGLKSAACTSYGKSKVCKELLSFIDTMQEECNITGIKSKEATGKLKELVDNVSEEGLEKARKQLEEESKVCVYSTANYTNADRLTLCKDCKELCRYNQKTAAESLCISQEAYDEIVDKCLYGSEVELVNNGDLPKEEPVSDDLNTVAIEYANNITEKIGYRLQLRRAVCFGAKWKEQQMMAKAVDATVHIDAGGYPYIPQMELYDYCKDIPLAKEGDKYKVVLIKED